MSGLRIKLLTRAIQSIFIVSALGTAQLAIAQSAPASVQAAKQHYQIKAGALDEVLVQFSAQAGVQLSFVPGTLQGIRSNGLQGYYTPEEGFKALLTPHQLRVQQNGHGYALVKIDTVTSQRLGASIAALAAGSRSMGQEADLPQISVQASQISVYEEPRSVSEITREQLDHRPARHAADMLEQTSGVYSSVSQQDPALSVNIRGMQDYGRVNMNIDGMRQNFQKSGHGQRNGQMYVDAEMLSGVRIEKGLTSGMGSAGTLGGIATFKTIGVDDILKEDQKLGGRVRASTGSNASHFIGSAMFAGRGEDMDAIIGISQRRFGDYNPGQQGEIGNIRVNNNTGKYDQFVDHLKNNPITDSNFAMRSYMGKVGLNLPQGQRLQFSYIRNETDTPNASALKDIQDGSNYYLGWTRTGFSEIASQSFALDYTASPPGQTLYDIKAKLYYVDTQDHTDTFPTNSLGNNGYWSTTRLQTFGFQAENTSRLQLSEKNLLSLNYGVDAFYDKGNSDSNREIMIGTTPKGNRMMSSIFTNLTWHHNDWLTMQGGLRFDHYRLRGNTGFVITSFNYTQANPCTERRITQCNPTVRAYNEWNINDSVSNLSPTFAIAIKPNVDWLEFFANYGKSWRPPAITETLTYGSAHSTSTQYPNPYLKAENTRGWETGFNILKSGLLTANDQFSAKVAYFDTRVDNYINLHINVSKPGLLSPSIGNAAYLNNILESKFRGIEFQLNYDTGPLYMDFNYTRMLGKNNYCIKPAWLGNVTTVGGSAYNWYAMPNGNSNEYVTCNDGSIFNSSAFLPGDRGSLTLGGRALNRRLDAGVVVRFNPGYQDQSTPSNFPYLADWPSYTLYDFYASYQVSDNLILRGSVENATNRAYVVNYGDIQSSTLGRGRTYQVGVEYRF